MRVATWNLERACGAKAEGQRRVLDEIAPDIAVLTEVTADSWTGDGDVVTSPACRPSRFSGEAWGCKPRTTSSASSWNCPTDPIRAPDGS